MPTLLDRCREPGEVRETGWVSRLFNRDGYTPEYQELKFTLHRKLLDRINLEALSSMAGERVRAEIRAAVAKLVEEEKTPSQPGGEGPRDRGDSGRGFRPRPARAAPAGPHHQRHSGHHAATGLRGARRQALPHAGGVQGRRAPAAHHRKDRFAGGPPRGRIVAPGGRPPAGRFARQRRHPAGGRGRAAAFHPPFRPPRPARARTWWPSWP